MSESWVVITSRAGTLKKGEWKLAGHTLVEWVLEQIKGMPNVVVTTDQPEVMLLAHKMGAQVVVRPDALAQGQPGMQAKAVLHALEVVRAPASCLVHLVQPTSPFVERRHLLLLEEALAAGTVSSAQTIHAVPHNYHEVNQRVVRNDIVDFLDWEARHAMQNKQSKPKRYAFGNLVTTNHKWLRKTENFFTYPSRYIEISRLESLDVDNAKDLQVAECLVRCGLIKHPFKEDLTYA